MNWDCVLRSAGALVALAAGAASAWAGAPIEARTIALTGQQAPGMDPGVLYGEFLAPTINGSGRVAFRSTLTGPGVTSSNNQALWSDRSGAMEVVLRAGDQAPGAAPGALFFSPSTIQLNNAGQLLFRGAVDGAAALWKQGAGAAQLLVRAGDPAVGAGAGVTFGAFYAATLSDAGNVAFKAQFSGSGPSLQRIGIWSVNSGGLQMVAKVGELAPGFPPEQPYTFTSLGASSSATLAQNGAGAIAFSGRRTGSGAEVEGIWSDRAGGMGPVGVTTAHVTNPSIGSAGDIAFGAQVGTAFGGVYQVYRAAAAGASGFLNTPSPEGPSHILTSIRSDPVINGHGQIAVAVSYQAVFNGPSKSALWSEGPGGLTMLAYDGDQAPGCGPGVQFDVFTRVSINDLGHTVFLGLVQGTGVTSLNDWGIWGADQTGELRLIAREGDLFNVSDDPGFEDLRRISSLELGFLGGNAAQDGRGCGFNDRGQLVFAAKFTDGTSGIFMVEVPAPSTALALVFPAAAFAGRRRRKEV